MTNDDDDAMVNKEYKDINLIASQCRLEQSQLYSVADEKPFRVCSNEERKKIFSQVVFHFPYGKCITFIWASWNEGTRTRNRDKISFTILDGLFS